MTNPAKLNARPTRRSALKTIASTSAAATLATPFVHAADKAGKKKPLVGTGEHTYECFHDWGMENLPAGAHYGGASHGVAIDQSGLIYITHYGDPGSIFVFDPDGTFVKSMGDFHQLPSDDGKTKSGRGHGIDIRAEGAEEFIYLAPSESALDFVKITLNGEIVWRTGREKLQQDTGRYPEDAKYRPTNTSFSPDGGYFLGDGYGSGLLHQYDRHDKYVRTIGGIGTDDGQFHTPHGQWLDKRDGTPKLVVADRANKRLQWFDMEGNHLKTLDGFLFPADIDIADDIMLVPDLHCRVTLLDRENQVVAQLSDDPTWREEVLGGNGMRGKREKWLPGKFVHPHDACFDADGNIFVAEWVITGRVTKLRKVS